jgi:hypothetical protein
LLARADFGGRGASIHEGPHGRAHVVRKLAGGDDAVRDG